MLVAVEAFRRFDGLEAWNGVVGLKHGRAMFFLTVEKEAFIGIVVDLAAFDAAQCIVSHGLPEMLLLRIVGLLAHEFGFAFWRDGGTPQLPVVREDLFKEEPVSSIFMDIGKYGVLKRIETAVRRRHKNVELFFRRLRKEVLFVEIDFGDHSMEDGGSTTSTTANLQKLIDSLLGYADDENEIKGIYFSVTAASEDHSKFRDSKDVYSDSTSYRGGNAPKLAVPGNPRWVSGTVAAWDAVANADYYSVSLYVVDSEEDIEYSVRTTSISYDFKNLINEAVNEANDLSEIGDIEFVVSAKSNDSSKYRSSAKTEPVKTSYRGENVPRLAVPGNPRWASDTVAAWDAVANADHYTVSLRVVYSLDETDIYEYTTTSTSYDFKRLIGEVVNSVNDLSEIGEISFIVSAKSKDISKYRSSAETNPIKTTHRG